MGSTVVKKTFVKSALCMDTVIQIKVVTALSIVEAEERITRAFESFHFVENICSRFCEQSEVMRLSQQIGIPVQVSDILFEAVRFAFEVADFTDGAFDPTVGSILETYGFHQHYLTGQNIESKLNLQEPVSYHDILLDENNRTILLRKPLILDLGAVAKGMAIDLAIKELSYFDGVMVDAGGDIFVVGQNEQDEPWRIGIRHPFEKEKSICTLKLTNAAVCTSGSYERISPVKENIHHLIDPRSGISRSDILSCTVIAPFAMMADTFSTAAFILGAEKGIHLLETAGLDGMLITDTLDLHMTKEMVGYLYEHE